MSATGPASAAYAADHTSRDERTKTMARLGTANSMGTILGPAVSGALATFGLLAPLYFAAALAAAAAMVVWRKLPVTPDAQHTNRKSSRKLRYTDKRITLLLITAVGLFIGFSSIQQTSRVPAAGQTSSQRHRDGANDRRQLCWSALLFTFLTQITVMQRLQLRPTQFVRIGLLFMLIGAAVISGFETFMVLSVGMAFLGIGMALVHAFDCRGCFAGRIDRGTGRSCRAGKLMSRNRVCSRPHLRRRVVSVSHRSGATVQHSGCSLLY